MANIREKQTYTDDGKKTNTKTTTKVVQNTKPYGSNYGGVTSSVKNNTSYGSNYNGSTSTPKTKTSVPKVATPKTKVEANKPYGSNYGGVTSNTNKNTSYGSNYGGGITNKTNSNSSRDKKRQELKQKLDQSGVETIDRNARRKEAERQNANELLQIKSAERNARISENPDYEMDLYEFQDQDGNRLSGGEYLQKRRDHETQVENLYKSYELLEQQYKIDGDRNKYLMGHNELMNKYNSLINEEDYLNSFKADYNNSVMEEYEANQQRMSEILNIQGMMKNASKLVSITDSPVGAIINLGGQFVDLATNKDGLTSEYLALKDRNEEIKNLYEDILYLREEDYYNYLLENGDENEISDLESYIASQANNGTLIGYLSNRIKKLDANLTTPVYAVTAATDIAFDLLGEHYGNVMQGVADNLYENGYIDDQSFNGVSAVAKKLKDIEFDNENNLSQQLREYREKINLEVHSAGKSDFEMIAGDVMDSAVENYARNMMLGKAGTYAMALSQFGDSYYENRQKGYTPTTSALNAFGKAYLTWWSENLTTQRYFETLGATAGMNLNNQFFSILANRFVSAVPEEGLEEGAEYLGDYAIDVITNLLEPNVDQPEFRAGDLIKGSLMAMASTTMSSTAGAVTSAIAYENAIPPIMNNEQYEQFKVELNNIIRQYDITSDIESKAILKNYINLAKGRLTQYENLSKTAGKIQLQSDQVIDIGDQQANQIYKQSLVPEAISASNEQEKTDHEIPQEKTYLNRISTYVLNSKGIIMEPEEYLQLSDRQRAVVDSISNAFNKVEGNNVQLRFSTSVEPGGEYGVDEQTGQAYILVNPNSKTLAEDIFKHEIIHSIKDTEAWNYLQQRTNEILGDKKESKKKRLRRAGYGENVVDEELVSYIMQDQYELNAFLKELGKKDTTKLQKLFNLVSDFTSQIKGQTEAEKLGQQIAQAYKEVMGNPRLTLNGAMLNNDGADTPHYTDLYNALTKSEWREIYNSPKKQDCMVLEQDDGSYKIVNYQKDETGKPRRLEGVYKVDNKEQLNYVLNTLDTIKELERRGVYGEEEVYYQNGRSLATMYADGKVRRYTYENDLYNLINEEPGRSYKYGGEDSEGESEQRNQVRGRTGQNLKNKDITSLIGDDYVAEGKAIAWKDDRIDAIIKENEDKNFAYSGHDKYQYFYALNISPKEYIDLSFIFEPKHNQIWRGDIEYAQEFYNNGKVVVESLGERDYRRLQGYMYLMGEFDGTKLKLDKQEGNHRSIILADNGYTKMPIILGSNKPLSGTIVMEGMDAKQMGVQNANTKVITEDDYVEFKEENRDRLISKFGSKSNANTLYNKDINLNATARENLEEFFDREDILEALDLLEGYTGINTNVGDLEQSVQRASKTREEVLRENIEDIIDGIDDIFQEYLKNEDVTPEEVDLENLWWAYGDPYSVEGGPLEHLRGDQQDELADLAVEYIKEKYNIGNNATPTAYANKDIDLNDSELQERLDQFVTTPSEELSEMIRIAEDQIKLNGDLPGPTRQRLEEKLYEATMEETEVEGEYSPKQINKFLQENPIRWRALKGDNRLSMLEFQKEHPNVKFAKNGTKNWDTIAMEFAEQFPGLINPEDYTTAVDFYDAIEDIKNDLKKVERVQTISREEFTKLFDEIIDGFIEENQPQITRPKKVNLKALEKTREGFRKSVKAWVDDYDIIRKKYDGFDNKSFDSAIADVYTIGEVTDQTRQELKDSLIKNDFQGYYTDGKANEYVDSFVNEIVDYYVLEAEYLANQKYRDTIAKPANVINQAQDKMYEKDYDRSELAKAINDEAQNTRKRDIDGIYDLVQTLVDNLNNKVNVVWNRDLRECNDLVADGDMETRQALDSLIEEPVRQAQAEELKILTEWMNKVKDIQKEVGFSMYSKEALAGGWVQEGKKQDGTRYTIDDLKKDFPKKWKDIMKVVKFYDETMELFFGEENERLQGVYGDVEYLDELRTSRLQVQMEASKSIMEKREEDLKNNPNSKTQAGFSKAKKDFELAQKRYNAKLEENLNHTNSRTEVIPYRQNYFHHTNEVEFWKNAKAFFESIKNGLGRGNRIPTSLAGKTQYTKPRTTNQSYKWQQSQFNYSSSIFASLQHRIKEHANAMAFDPVVSYLRTVQSVMGELDNEKQINNYASWFNRYVNMLAKKSNDLDRVLRDMSPEGFINGLKILENRAKQNATFGNLSSALVQSGNYPIGLALAVKNGGKETINDIINGTAYYMMDQRVGGGPKDASTFLKGRFFDIELNDDRLKAKADKFGNFMMTALDKVTAENLWYTYYAQGMRLNNSNPVLYADEMTDRAIQGRHVSQMPVSQQSEIIKTIMPFQVEVNNQWQVMKDLAKGSIKGNNKANNIAGLIVMALTSAMMNAGFKKILGREPLFDPLTALIEILGDEDITLQEKERKLSARLLGEVMGAIPGGQYIPKILGWSDEEAKKFFGESDPSRYGVGNIGLSAIAELLRAEPGDESVKAWEDLLFTYGPSGYGKQMQKIYREAQDFGYLPKYKNGEWRRDPIHYTSTGGVAFVNNPSDIFDFLSGTLAGQYKTKAGKEYVDSNFSKLGKETLTDPNGEAIKGSKAMQVRKEYQDLGIYDEIVEQINSGKMTPGKAGLTQKVLNMSNDEFEEAYNGMLTKAEGISERLKQTYDWDDEKVESYQKALDIEADYKDGKKVTDSEALKTRKAMEDAGIYNDVLDFIEQNGLSYSDVGLGKRVVGYDEDEFFKAYAKKIGE